MASYTIEECIGLDLSGIVYDYLYDLCVVFEGDDQKYGFNTLKDIYDFVKNNKDFYTIEILCPYIIDENSGQFTDMTYLTRIINTHLLDIKDAEYLFAGCENLNCDMKLKLPANVDYMMIECKKFNSSVSGFDTKNVTSTCYMFEGCESLTNIYGLNLLKCKYAYRMFNKCINLIIDYELDLPEVLDALEMFMNCNKVTVEPSLPKCIRCRTTDVFGEGFSYFPGN